MLQMKGRDIQRARKQLELTQAGLAKLLKMTRTSVARMERGEQRIMHTTELAIRYLLGARKRGST